MTGGRHASRRPEAPAARHAGPATGTGPLGLLMRSQGRHGDDTLIMDEISGRESWWTDPHKRAVVVALAAMAVLVGVALWAAVALLARGADTAPASVRPSGAAISSSEAATDRPRHSVTPERPGPTVTVQARPETFWASGPQPTVTVNRPGPTVTTTVRPGRTVTVPGPTVTRPGPTVTVTRAGPTVTVIAPASP